MDAFEFARAKGIKTIRLGIHQAKLHSGLIEWTCTLDELEAFAAVAKAKAAKVEEAARMFSSQAFATREEWDKKYLNANPNEEECAFCRAMATCPAATRKLQENVGDFPIVDPSELPSVESVSDDDLGVKMQSTGFIEDWCKAVRAEVERRLLAGTPVPGFGLELGRKPPRKWGDPEVVEAEMKTLRMTIEDRYNLKLKSPTQIEALCDPKKNEKPILGPRQWKKLQAHIKQGDPSPSVKPADMIKNPYKPVPPSADAFAPVDDCNLA